MPVTSTMAGTKISHFCAQTVEPRKFPSLPRTHGFHVLLSCPAILHGITTYVFSFPAFFAVKPVPRLSPFSTTILYQGIALFKFPQPTHSPNPPWFFSVLFFFVSFLSDSGALEKPGFRPLQDHLFLFQYCCFFFIFPKFTRWILGGTPTPFFHGPRLSFGFLIRYW